MKVIIFEHDKMDTLLTASFNTTPYLQPLSNAKQLTALYYITNKQKILTSDYHGAMPSTLVHKTSHQGNKRGSRFLQNLDI